MKKIIFAICFVLIFPLSAGAQQDKKTAVYFYADWCSHCQKVNAYFTENGIYETYNIVKLNYDLPENKALLAKIFEDKGAKQSGIPAIIIDDQLLVGDAPIIKDFEPTIKKSKGTALSYVDQIRTGKRQSSGGVPLAALISAALVDAINPCAFAVLILLVATVTNAQGKRRALWAGLLFSFSIFLSYFVMGLGLYKAITIFNIPLVISTVVGVLAVIIGLANLKDAFWYGKWFIMEVPLSWRPKMQTILRHVTSPFGALTSGLLVSLFLLPCSSGPYVVIVGLLAERVNMASTVAQLFLYNAIFVMPMVLITLAMYFFDLKGGKLEKIRKENLKLLHAIAGAIMLMMGIYLLRGWL